eukprot:scaffold213_cov245-Pinguiococcus_pyrenoidosus.AAC.11
MCPRATFCVVHLDVPRIARVLLQQGFKIRAVVGGRRLREIGGGTLLGEGMHEIPQGILVGIPWGVARLERILTATERAVLRPRHRTHKLRLPPGEGFTPRWAAEAPTGERAFIHVRRLGRVIGGGAAAPSRDTHGTKEERPEGVELPSAPDGVNCVLPVRAQHLTQHHGGMPLRATPRATPAR